jgi:hypothetical protein
LSEADHAEVRIDVMIKTIRGRGIKEIDSMGLKILKNSMDLSLKTIVFICVFGQGLNLSTPAFAGEDRLIEPEHIANARFYLQTIGRGNGLSDLYGHTQLHIMESVSRRNFVVTWGVYDNFDPLFPINFYRGSAKFLILALPFAQSQKYYQEMKRYVEEDELVLTVEQKTNLLTRLEQTVSVVGHFDSHSSYVYKIYEDNCSTRIRDVLNDLLGGSIKQRFSQESTSITVRQILREGQSVIPLSSTFLEIIANKETDRTLSAWDYMYVPLQLRRYLRLVDNPATHEKLLGSQSRLLDFPEPDQPHRRDGFIRLALCFFFSVSVLLTAWRSSGKYLKKFTAIDGFSRFIVLSLVVVSSGLWWILVVNHIWTSHIYLKQNLNLMIFGPMDFIFGILAYTSRFAKLAAIFDHRRFRACIRAYAIMRVFLIVVAMLGSQFSFFAQDVSVSYFLAVPLVIFLIFALFIDSWLLRNEVWFRR